MAEPLFSPSWYRISRLQPRLKGHVRISRHVYGNELWYVIQDHASGQHFRFTPEVHHILALMDGKLSVQQLWEKGIERFGDEAPTQGEMVRVLSQLHSADMLFADLPPDTREIFRRSERTRESKIRSYLLSPLSWRFPLFDPDRFLSSITPLYKILFSRVAFVLWLALICVALVLAGRHWQALSQDVVDRLLSSQNLLILWIVYPLTKILHELGHAAAVKRWGGEVHEIGIMLVGFIPMPYVDASASAAFPEKRRRMIVSASGMMVELALAAIALFGWLAVEPGLVRSALYNIVLIGSISTVAFNGNPLLRYDGYYLFSDLIEEPNLAQRSNQYLSYLVQRHLFKVKNLDAPVIAPGKRFLVAAYAVVSFFYRIFIYLSLALVIASRFFIIGILLALWLCAGMIAVPAVKGMRFLFSSPVLREKRARALTVTAVLSASCLALIFAIPFPSWTRAEGIVWVPEDGHVRAKTDGFVRSFVALPNSWVKEGDVLLNLEDSSLAAQLDAKTAEFKALQARYAAEIITDRVQAQVTAEEMMSVRAALERAEERFRELSVASMTGGTFILPGADDLTGRFVKQGELLGYVIKGEQPTVRVVVQQDDVDLILRRNRGIDVKLAERLEETIPARVLRVIPGALDRLPSTVLGSGGGGRVAVDPTDGEGKKTLKKTFQVDIELPVTYERITIGGRVYVRFDHGLETLAVQWYRSLRRLFLRHFNV